MSPVTVTLRRTISRARNQFSTAFVTFGFLAVTSVLFAFRLVQTEGTQQLLSVLWGTSVAPFLPVVAAFLAMDSWSDERRTGRIDLLLTTAVSEREFVLGKFLGVWLALLVHVVLSLVATFVPLWMLSPATLARMEVFAFFPALFALALQGALWSAFSVAISALASRAFVAGSASVILLVLLPRGIWEALLLWGSGGRSSYGEMPFDAQVFDMASGVFSTGGILTLLVLTLAALFVASRCVAWTRLAGRGAGRQRLSVLLSLALSISSAVLFSALAFRLDLTLDLPIGRDLLFSPRTRQVLAESSGQVTVTAFLSRRDSSFRSVAHYLRTLKRQAESSGGLSLTLRFVDPKWDLGAAERLVRQGVSESSLVFEKGYRRTVLPLSSGIGDRAVVSSLQRVVQPPQRQNICWTSGHGESLFDAYDTFGMSDIARELSLNGYRHQALDISLNTQIPNDCALLIISGPRKPFARAEIQRIGSYLAGGGRLLLLMAQPDVDGLDSLLSGWGVRPLVQPLPEARTLSGTDVIVSTFGDHAICEGLENTRLILEKPLSFVNSALTDTGRGTDRPSFTPLAQVGSAVVAVAVERGGTLGQDVAVRPMRIVVVGDPTFVMNGQMSARANTNRDFFLNAVNFLSGTEILGIRDEEDSGVLCLDLDRVGRLRLSVLMAFGVPGLMLVLMLLVAMRRRLRK